MHFCKPNPSASRFKYPPAEKVIMTKKNDGDITATLQRVIDARIAVSDEARVEELKKIRARGALTARERIDALIDKNSFVEYGLLASSINPDVTAPADGIVTGLGAINGITVAILAYDYSVFAGSQGDIGHHKQARLLDTVAQLRCPLIQLLEGGGARAQEVAAMRSGNSSDFVLFPRLVGHVPIISVVFGRAFAGHAIQAGISDVVIATQAACIGVAGPPLVEAALGQKLTPEEIGPAKLHYAVGAVDCLVDDDLQAIAAARRYFELVTTDSTRSSKIFAEVPIPQLRSIVPENPRMAYDVRKVINLLVDTDTLFELRQGNATNLVTGLARVGGHLTGIIANQPRMHAGTIDSPAAMKMARFIRQCDRRNIPLLFLVDSPGFLIGPAAEEQGVVIHGSDAVIALAQASVPIMQIVLRKSYGMSSLVMGHRLFGGVLSLAWPTAEFGVMGLKGAAKIVSGGSAEAEDAQVAKLMERGSALGMARMFQFDDVIDPADTRTIIMRTLRHVASRPANHNGR
jgi:acetyl-CoA carboxylase carboxyltransferase component